jgi:hypothetical protein
MAEPGAEPTLRGYLHVVCRGRWWVAPVVGAVLNKATAQGGYGYYGGYRPYVLPAGASPDGAKAARNGRDKQNGLPRPAAHQARHGG